MKIKDLEYIKDALEQALNDYTPSPERAEHHFNLFANAIKLAEDELNLLNIQIVSTRTFNEECELYIDAETDEWVLKHKGVIKKRAKSKFECLLTKKALQKELGV